MRQRQHLPLLILQLLQVLHQVQPLLPKHAAQRCGGQLSRHAAVVQLLAGSGGSRGGSKVRTGDTIAAAPQNAEPH